MAVTQNYFTPERNYGQNPAPGRTEVKLAAGVIAVKDIVSGEQIDVHADGAAAWLTEKLGE